MSEATKVCVSVSFFDTNKVESFEILKEKSIPIIYELKRQIELKTKIDETEQALNIEQERDNSNYTLIINCCKIINRRI